MTSLTKPDPGTVLRRGPDNNREPLDALAQREQAICDRMAALHKEGDTLFLQPLPSHPIKAIKVLEKQINLIRKILAGTQDFLNLGAEDD